MSGQGKSKRAAEHLKHKSGGVLPWEKERERDKDQKDREEETMRGTVRCGEAGGGVNKRKRKKKREILFDCFGSAE